MTDSFANVQQRLAPLWTTISRFNEFEQTIIVVPSLSIPREFLEKLGPQAIIYEERMLFLLLLLKQPRARLVYVTSVPVEDRIIDYYLSLLPGVIPSHARNRLFLVSVDDRSLDPLSQKILDDPKALEEIRRLVIDPERAHIVPYITTEFERDLAVELGIPIFGCDPSLAWLGTKSGAREVFESEGIPHPRGIGNLRTIDDLVDGVARMKEQLGVGKVVIKHNEGVSGVGNATFDLYGLPPAGAGTREEIRRRLEILDVAEMTSATEYLSEFERLGGVVEELIVAEEIRSPSVQLRVTPLGDVEVLSTHDQLLGGQSGQIYLGCAFPADGAYAASITESALIAARRLAKEGVLGRFALDFVAVKRANRWDHYAVEINLRKGGTTHPFLTLQFLTGGNYDPKAGRFLSPRGESRALVASDHVVLGEVRDLGGLFDKMVTSGLHFDNSTQVGVVLHMLGAAEPHGIVGITAVGETREAAEALFSRTLNELGARLS